jgi:hypothetical protein
MRASWLVLLVTSYLALDVGNPLMPGALTFGADSVEVRQAERFRAHHDVALLPAAALPARVEPIDRPVAASRAPAGVIHLIPASGVQRARSVLSAPSYPSEDH